jgi:hypothetical protein
MELLPSVLVKTTKHDLKVCREQRYNTLCDHHVPADLQYGSRLLVTVNLYVKMLLLEVEGYKYHELSIPS